VAWTAILAGVAAYAQSQLFCDAGTTTPPGQPLPLVNVTLSLNTNITNRLLGGGFMDALLLIDEPFPSTPILPPPNGGVSSDFNPAQALCYSSATAAPGSCNYLLGNGGGGYQYSSSPIFNRMPSQFTPPSRTRQIRLLGMACLSIPPGTTCA